MGIPMIQNLLKGGVKVTVWNRTQSKLDCFENESNLKKAPSLSAAFQDNNIIILMVADIQAVKEVLFHDKDKLKDKLLIQMSTIGSDESNELANQVHECHARFLEAPVLGSIDHAQNGRLQVLVSGDESIYEDVWSLLRLFGMPRYIGCVGQATALKLALNQIIAAQTCSFALSLSMVEKARIHPDVFMDVVRTGPFYSPYFDFKLPQMLNRDFSEPKFSLRLLMKDVKLIEEYAQSSGLDCSLVRGMLSILEKGMAKGDSEKDMSCLYSAINPEE